MSACDLERKKQAERSKKRLTVENTPIRKGCPAVIKAMKTAVHGENAELLLQAVLNEEF